MGNNKKQSKSKSKLGKWKVDEKGAQNVSIFGHAIVLVAVDVQIELSSRVIYMHLWRSRQKSGLEAQS